MSATTPVISGFIDPNQATADDAALSPFSDVTITDGGGAETETVTVNLDDGADGTLSDAEGGVSGATFTFTGSAAAVTAALDALVFTPTDHQVAPGQTVESNLSLTVDSSTGESAGASVSVTATAGEDAPEIGGGTANQAVTDHATIAPFSTVTVTDPDTNALTAVLTIANGDNRGDFTAASVAAGWVRTVSGPDIVYTQTFATGPDIGATVQSAVQALVFQPREHAITPGSTEVTDFTVVVTDASGQSAANDQIISTITTALDDAPTITGTVALQTLDDNAIADLFSGVSVNDIDPGTTDQVTVTLSAAANGTLASAVAGSYDATSGIYTVVGSAASVTQALDGLVFTPTQHQVSPGGTVTTDFTIAVNDGYDGTANDATTSAVVTAIDTPPVIAGTMADQATSDHQTIAPFATVALTDAEPDAATAIVTIVNGVNRGSFTLASTSGWTVATAPNGSDLIYTRQFGATQNTGALIQAAIQALVFQPREYAIPPGTSESTGFILSVSELGGGSATDTTTSVITTAGEDTPAIAGTVADQATGDASVTQPFSAVTITDIDVGKTETVTITPSSAANGVLGNLGGFTASGGSLTMSGSAAAVTAAIDALTFTPTDHEVAPGSMVTTGFTIVDADDLGQTATDSTTSVVATAGDTPPVLSGQAAAVGTDDHSSVAPFSGAIVTDVDFGTTDRATVVIGVPANGTLSDLEPGSYDAGTGIYVVSGSAADVTAALDELVFTPTPHQVPPGMAQTTSISVLIDDGYGGTASTAVLVVATALDDAPTITGAVAAQPDTDRATVAPLAGVTIADVDVGTTETVTLTLENPDGSAGFANGTLGDTGAGSYDPATGTYTVTGSAAAVTTALDALAFTPTEYQVAPGDTVTTVFALTIDDGNGGSASDQTASVIATAQEDAPTIAGTGPAAGITDSATAMPFAAVTVGDVDAGKTETVTVTLGDAANGALSGGAGSFANGVYTVAGTATDVTAALDALVFTPAAHQVAVGATVTTEFTIAVDDGVGPTVSDSASSIVVTAGENAPVIGGAAAGQLVTDLDTIAPLSHVTITDPDFDNFETVTVTLDTPVNGTLSDMIAGSYDSGTGVFSVSGSATAVTAALDALVFTPTAHEVPPGSTVTTRLSIAVDDGQGGMATDTATTVLAYATDTPPAIGGTLAGQATSDIAPIAPLATFSVTDPDRGTAEFVTVTLSDPANGALGNLGGGAYAASTGSYTVSGSADAVTAALDGLVFMPTAHQVTPGTAVTTVFAITVDDGYGGVSDASSSVAATALDDPPSISGTGPAPGISDEATASPFGSVVITDDLDVGKTDTVTVALSDPANGTLSSVAGGSFADGVWTDSGTASAVTAATDALVFSPTAHQVAPGQTVTTQFTVAVDDGHGGVASDAATSIAVTAAEDTPVIAGGLTGQAVSDHATIAPFDAVMVADPDTNSITASVTIIDGADRGSFTADSAAGWSENFVGNDLIYTRMFGPAPDIGSVVQSAIQALVFQPLEYALPPGNSETTHFCVAVDDGTGPVTDAAAISTVTTAQDDAPSLSGMVAGQATTDLNAISPFSAVTVIDPDAGVTETLTASLDPAAGSLSSSGAGSYDPATGVFIVTGSAATVTMAIDSLVFTPTAHEAAPGQTVTTGFTIGVEDGLGGSVSDATTSVVTTATDTAPTITGTAAGQSVTDESTVQPFAGVTIADIDTGTTDTVTVTLSEAANGAFANLADGSFSNGVYSVSGNAQAVTAAVQGLVFVPTAHQVTPGASVVTGFTVAVDDGHGGTASDLASSVIASAVDDTPVIGGALSDQPVSDAATVAPFAAMTIADPDLTSETATVTIANGTQQGDFSAVSTAGWTRDVSGSDIVYTQTFAAAADIGAVVQTAMQALVFVPTAHEVAPGESVTTQFTVAVSDGQGGNAADATTSVIATAADTAPTIAGTLAAQPASDEAAVAPFATVVIATVDFGTTQTVTVTSDNAGNGVLSDAAGGSVNDGIYTVTGSAAVVTAAIEALTFAPTTHQVTPGQAVTTGFTIAVDDGDGGTVSDSATSVVAIAADDAPSIAGTVAGITTTDESSVQPFLSAIVSDIDTGTTETVTVAPSNLANGQLGSAGAGSAAGGVYTVSGSAAAVTAALEALTFTPTAHQVAPGSTVTTGFTIAVADGHGGTAVDSGTTLVATATETAPMLLGLPVSLAAAGPIAPFPGAQVVDVDTGTTETLTVTLGQPGNGTLGDLGGGAFANGVYSISGSAALVEAALDGLVFTPSAVLGSALPSVTTSFAVAVSDGLGGSASGATTLTVTLPTASSDSFGAAVRQAIAALLSEGSGGEQSIDFTAPGQPLGAPAVGQLDGLTIGDASDGQTVAVPAGAAIVTDAADGPTTVSGGGAAGQTVIALGGDLTYQTGGGSGTLLADQSAGNIVFEAPGSGGGNFVVATGAGNDVLLAGSGNDELSGGGGQNNFFLGAGQTVVHSDGADTVVAGSGATTIIGGADAGDSGHSLLVFGGAGSLLVDNVTGDETVAGGSGSVTVFGGAGSAELFGGSAGHNVLVAGMGASTLIGGGADDVLFAQGSGDDVLAAGGDNATLQGGGATGNNLYFGGSGHVVIAAGRGDDTIVGGSGQATLFAGAGQDLIYAAAGGGDIFAASGNATLVGSGGPETYVFVNGAGGGSDEIFNFHAATDTVALGGFSAAAIAEALQQQTYVNGSTVLSLSDGTRVTFAGLSHLASANVY